MATTATTNWPKVFAAPTKLKRGRDWSYDWQPYCLAPRPSSEALPDALQWIAVNRGYKTLGVDQDYGGWCDWDAPDNVVWEFTCGDPRLLLSERIFCGASPNNHPKSSCLYLPFYARDYGARVSRLIEATTDPCRYAALLLNGLSPREHPIPVRIKRARAPASHARQHVEVSR
jgi:hypothetical protein